MEALVFNSSMSVLLNGSPTKDFKVSLGLRHGDPISPFLFLLVAEGFSSLLFQTVSSREFKAFHLNISTHVELSQFTADTMLTGESSWSNLLSIKTLLRGLNWCWIFG